MGSYILALTDFWFHELLRDIFALLNDESMRHFDFFP